MPSAPNNLPIRTTVVIDPSSTLSLIEHANREGVAHSLEQTGDTNEDGELEFFWNPDVEVPDIRIFLKPDGTWRATMNVTLGKESE